MAGPVLRFADGPLEVELLPELGGRMHRLRAFGQDVLRTPPTTAAYAADPYFWGSYVMAPWCNRLLALPTSVGARTVDLPASYKDGTAIHGQVVGRPWAVDDDGGLVVRGGGDGWPWPYEAWQRLTLDEATLRIQMRVTNLADDPMPAGLGIHPWFLRPLDVRVAAQRVAPSNLDPEGQPEALSGPFDLRKLQPIPNDLDASWTEVADPAIELRWPSLGLGATLRATSSGPISVAIASPAAVEAVAVEAQTHLPGGLRRLLAGEPQGLTLLDPGAALTLEVELAFRETG